jgi:hypothetical protein
VVEATEQLAQGRPEYPADRGWAVRMRRALTFGLAGTDTTVVALAGFLLRGGILVLLLPSVVLPSVIGVAGATGVDAFGIDGHPTLWLFEMVAVASAAAALYLVLAFVVGSLIEVWLVGSAVAQEGRGASRPRALPELGLLLDLAAIRAICAAPVAAVMVWAGSRIYTAAYIELTTPSNLVTPLAVRVVESAADAVLVVGLAWLASEVVGAIAVRRLILLGTGVRHSIGGALAQLIRRPVSHLATIVVSYGTSLVVTGLAIAATATAFDWCRVAARNQEPLAITIVNTTRDFRPVVFILAAAALCGAWVAALAISGMASAWRSAALTGETVNAVPAVDWDAVADRCGLSGETSSLSGD